MNTKNREISQKNIQNGVLRANGDRHLHDLGHAWTELRSASDFLSRPAVTASRPVSQPASSSGVQATPLAPKLRTRPPPLAPRPRAQEPSPPSQPPPMPSRPPPRPPRAPLLMLTWGQWLPHELPIRPSGELRCTGDADVQIRVVTGGVKILEAMLHLPRGPLTEQAHGKGRGKGPLEAQSYVMHVVDAFFAFATLVCLWGWLLSVNFSRKGLGTGSCVLPASDLLSLYQSNDTPHPSNCMKWQLIKVFRCCALLLFRAPLFYPAASLRHFALSPTPLATF